MDDPSDRAPLPDAIGGADYALTIEGASRRFVDAGVPRSVRTIQRYCQVGYLDCISVQGELASRYVVGASSVTTRIEELLQVEKIMGATAIARRRAKPREDALGRDEARDGAPNDDSIALAKLRDKVRMLEIDNRVRDELIGRLDNERSNLLTQVIEKSHTIGRLETELRLLGTGHIAGENSEALDIHNRL